MIGKYSVVVYTEKKGLYLDGRSALEESSMLFCNTCGDQRLWPRSFSQTYSKCEVCGICNLCSDVPAGVLPTPSTVDATIGEDGKRDRPDVAT